MHIADVSKGKHSDITIWAIVAALVFIVFFSLVARASLNLQGALTHKPDLAVYVLLPEEDITEVELLRELNQERDYLLTTKNGMKFAKLRQVDGEWTLATIEDLRDEHL